MMFAAGPKGMQQPPGRGLVLFALALLMLLPAPRARGQDNLIDDLLGQSNQEVPSAVEVPVTFSTQFYLNDDGKTGKLAVTASLEPGWHIFSVTQPRGGPMKTILGLVAGFEQAKITGPFVPDSDPHEFLEPGFDVAGEEHEGIVTWTAPIEFAEGVEPKPVEIPVFVDQAQVCLRNGSCIPINDLVLKARYSATPGEVRSIGKFRAPGSHVEVRGRIDHTAAEPGATVSLTLELHPDPGYSVTAYTPIVSTSGITTLVSLTRSHGARIDTLNLDEEGNEESERSVRKTIAEPVAWTFPVVLPDEMEAGAHTFRGVIGYEVLETAGGKNVETRLDEFEFDLRIGPEPVPEENPLSFAPSRGTTYESLAGLVQKDREQQLARQGDFAGYPLGAVLALAFVAGLILNVMPCVLPVIGIKVLSFVQQAGQNPRRILALNLVFSLGIISVFILLAMLATFPQVFGLGKKIGWGGLFESQEFVITMVAVIFAFGLSFLGVWEIPIPGFVSTASGGKAARGEGFIGAFLKGILTTLLATPCSGPLLIPAVTWGTAQPAPLTFLVFLALGLGLAFPFIVIGFRPSLVSWLPKPGEWMETFKKWMGFVLLGGAIFFYGAVTVKYRIPVLTMLLFIAVACWMYGRISFADPAPVRQRKRLMAGAVLTLGIYFSLFVLVPRNELEWKPFSRDAVDEFVNKGAVVFVDFTADW